MRDQIKRNIVIISIFYMPFKTTLVMVVKMTRLVIQLNCKHTLTVIFFLNLIYFFFWSETFWIFPLHEMHFWIPCKTILKIRNFTKRDSFNALLAYHTHALSPLAPLTYTHTYMHTQTSTKKNKLKKVLNILCFFRNFVWSWALLKC